MTNAAQSDVPLAELEFVDPEESGGCYRVVLWAAPGEGKSVGAATAPDPIVVVSADRPRAYHFAKRHPESPAHGKDIRETRYRNSHTLVEVYRYLKAHPEVRSIILDPFHSIYDRIVDEAPRRSDGDPDYQWVNKKLLGFLYSLREFDANVVIVAHEKLSDGKKGDGKLYPQLGGPVLINKVCAESDIVAHVEREEAGEGQPARYMAQLTPKGNLVCKQSTTGPLGDRREIDLTEWFEVASTFDVEDTSDLPWDDAFKEAAATEEEPDAETEPPEEEPAQQTLADGVKAA